MVKKTTLGRYFFEKPRREETWQYKVDWPNDALDFEGKVPLPQRQQIARRLIGYLLFPPPVLAGPGGRPAKDSRRAAKRRKRTKLDEIQHKTHEQLKTYLAFELASQLAVYEKNGTHRRIPEPAYDAVFREFRLLGGFGRLLSMRNDDDVARLATGKLDRSKWIELVVVFLVFDLIARHAQRGVIVSEADASKVVLLCQDLHGFKNNTGKLSSECMKYRSVAHLLVGILSACYLPTSAIESHKRPAMLEPTIEGLRKALASNLSAALTIAKQFEQAIVSSRLANGESKSKRHRLVRMPENLKVTQTTEPRRGLAEEDELVAMLEADRKRFRGLGSITSNNAKTKRTELLLSPNRP